MADSKKKEDIKNYICRNYLSLAVLLVSTAYFMIQHSIGPQWDFLVYISNAKYLFDSGTYFEWYRSPLISVFMYLLSFLGWKCSEYLYFVFASALYFVSADLFSRKWKLDMNLFYPLSMSFFFLFYGASNGTEILSISFILLFFAYIEHTSSGLFIGLAFLSRYTVAPLLIFLVIQRNIKKMLISLSLFALSLSPWLLYNYYKTGNPLMSMIDSYSLNVKYRLEYMMHPPSVEHFVLVFGLLAPLFVIGVYRAFSGIRPGQISVRKIIGSGLKSTCFKDIVMLLMFAVSVYSYMGTPFKVERYLFNLVVPITYFSVRYLQSIDLVKARIISGSVVILNFIIAFLVLFYTSSSVNVFLSDDFADVKDCKIISNGWAPINYRGFVAEPVPSRTHKLVEAIDDNYMFLYFKHVGEPEYMRNQTFSDRLPVIRDSKDYTLYGTGVCDRRLESYEFMYLDSLKKMLS